MTQLKTDNPSFNMKDISGYRLALFLLGFLLIPFIALTLFLLCYVHLPNIRFNDIWIIKEIENLLGSEYINTVIDGSIQFFKDIIMPILKIVYTILFAPTWLNFFGMNIPKKYVIRLSKCIGIGN
ncbi:hypothetical protein DAPK24_044260 [Pichia kluyveri]|uniref:Uncharacterized protein n=1 Tax=Pichia kluyveri TaxID=36015 RepID=A0AAV5R9C8_PICKL|nr:hypothetical protein DAPK24_044260 [Pichia kluyveri]